MGEVLTLKAPAKVNLHLEVLGKRSDGYHEIVSIFQMVSLYDILQFRSLKEESAFVLEGDFNILESENLITRAVSLFRQQSGLTTGVGIKASKGIPWGAGLGGGSSDAAATLMGLNTLFAAGLSLNRLCHMAEILGSDVPFFLNGPAAVVSGRGERIGLLAPRTDYELVVICPKYRISTREAYGWLDASAPRPVQDIPKLVERISREYLERPCCRWDFRNSFQKVVEQRFPQAGKIVSLLKELGAEQAGISGSGSATVGLFADKKAAEGAKTILEPLYPLVAVVNPLAKTPSAALE